MPKVDFRNMEDAQGYTPIPKGRYLCYLADINETTTRAGYEMWRAKFEIIEGTYTGGFIYDNIIFNPVGLKRVRCLCNALGLDITKECNLTPQSILGRSCFVDTFIKDFRDRHGELRQGNEVSFYGFSSIPKKDTVTPQAGNANDDDLPF